MTMVPGEWRPLRVAPAGGQPVNDGAGAVDQGDALGMARRRFIEGLREISHAAETLPRRAVASIGERRPERVLEAITKLRFQLDELEANFRAAWGEPLGEAAG